MSDTGLTVPGMTGPPRRYDVTITVDQDGGHPSPVEFAVAAQQGHRPERPASSAHTAGQIVSIVAVPASDQPAAVAVVSDALVKAPGRAVHR